MDLHERLNTARTVTSSAREPLNELKNQIHLRVIGELGPQVFTQSMDPDELSELVVADIRRHLAGEVGLSRDDREALTTSSSPPPPSQPAERWSAQIRQDSRTYQEWICTVTADRWFTGSKASALVGR